MKNVLALALFVGVIGGCNSGEVPIENAPQQPQASTAPPAAGTETPAPQNTGQAIGSNPNLPPAAKEALMGKGR